MMIWLVLNIDINWLDLDSQGGHVNTTTKKRKLRVEPGTLSIKVYCMQ